MVIINSKTTGTGNINYFAYLSINYAYLSANIPLTETTQSKTHKV